MREAICPLRRPGRLCAILVVGVFGAAAWAGEPHADLDIGQSGDATSPPHKLGIIGDPLSESFCTELEFIEGTGNPVLDGNFAAHDPHWENPGVQVGTWLPLLTGHQVALVRDHFDAGISMTDQAFNAILAADGAHHTFAADGDGLFHEDLHVIADGSLPTGVQFYLTFHLADQAGLHVDSDPFVLCFETVPEPSSAMALLVGVVCLAGRRARKHLLRG